MRLESPAPDPAIRAIFRFLVLFTVLAAVCVWSELDWWKMEVFRDSARWGCATIWVYWIARYASPGGVYFLVSLAAARLGGRTWLRSTLWALGCVTACHLWLYWEIDQMSSDSPPCFWSSLMWLQPIVALALGALGAWLGHVWRRRTTNSGRDGQPTILLRRAIDSIGRVIAISALLIVIPVLGLVISDEIEARLQGVYDACITAWAGGWGIWIAWFASLGAGTLLVSLAIARLCGRTWFVSLLWALGLVTACHLLFAGVAYGQEGLSVVWAPLPWLIPIGTLACGGLGAWLGHLWRTRSRPLTTPPSRGIIVR